MKGGEDMEVVRLQDVVVSDLDKKDLPWLQLFDTGYRVTSDNIDWSRWNGCVYSDIDSKHYFEECRKFDVDNLCKMLYEYLLINVNYNFYCLQQSHSKTGFHILFYFDVPKSEESFRKCAQFVQDRVREAFYKIGAAEIYDWPKVNDGCSKSPLQGMFLTGNPIQYGYYEQNGFGGFEDIDTYQLRSEKDKIVSDVKKDGTKLFEFDSYIPVTQPVRYKDHHQRWSIYDALIGTFGDKKRVDTEWESICELLPEENGHYRSFYLKEPDKNNWFNRYSSATRVNVDLLKEFGYSFKKVFEPIDGLSTYVPDEVYELKDDQKLSDLNIKWDKKRINHLFAGCSFGKTYNAKVLAKHRFIEDMNWIFGERQTKVCFISPMKSINIDSFEGVENWIIVDSDHKFENEYIYGTIQRTLDIEGLNICTTWESFSAYGMYKYNFDYIIVDEIHSLYSPDYRLVSIRDMKQALSAAKGIRIVMTGTPSYELEEFDCKKILVKKTQKKVPAEIVFYNKSFKGHYMNDILEWTKEKNHQAILFDDHVNYKTEESFKKYGLDCFIFNSKFTKNVEKVLTEKKVTAQISAFSVYGQAGINLYLDEDKKVRVYIPNSNGMSIIQYANRIRNKEVIDKIMIGYKRDDISNGVRSIKEHISYSDIPEKVDQLNKISFYEKNPMSMITRSAIKNTLGLNMDYLDFLDGKYSINESLYPVDYRIKQVSRYEKQIQVIYDRLLQNDFEVKLTYLEKDTPDQADTKIRSNTFAGQIVKIDFDKCMKEQRYGGLWFKPYESLKKVCTGDLEETIESLFNGLLKLYGYEGAKESFNKYVQNCLLKHKTVRKTDIENFEKLITIKTQWDEYYDNSFVAALKFSNWTVAKITAAYVRAVYKDGLKWEKVADDSFSIIKKLKRASGLVDGFFDDIEKVNKVKVENDDLTQKIYDYVVRTHTRGRKKKVGDVSRITKWRRKKEKEQENVSK